ADSVVSGKSILVVDDDVRNIFSLTSMLEDHGMIVRFAENGKQAIEQLKKDPNVDAVLMDVMMPEMDGYETTKAIRAMDQFKTLPIIALTAKAMKGDREKCIAAGASDYITKPVDTEQLLSLLRVWLYKQPRRRLPSENPSGRSSNPISSESRSSCCWRGYSANTDSIS